MRYVSSYVINDGYEFKAYEGTSYNSVLKRTRRLFSGQGYRLVAGHCDGTAGFVKLVNPRGDVAIISVVPA